MSDSELFRAWRAGDRRAGSQLFTRHFDSVYRFFRNKLDGDVEDLVQRTFVACVEANPDALESTLSNLERWAQGIRRQLAPT